MIRSLLVFQRLRFLDKSSVRFLFNSQHPVFKQNTQLPDYDISDEHIVVDSNLLKKDEAPRERKVYRWLTKKTLKENFVKSYDLTEEEATGLIEENNKVWKFPLDSLQKVVAFLKSKNISSKSIWENPWLLGADLNYLEKKVMLVNRLGPRDINDFVPLMKVSPLALYRIEKSIEEEKDRIPEGNLIYYFSKRLGLEASIVSKHFAEHLFIFEAEFGQIEQNLKVMMDYDISPIHIIRDLWAFRYDPKKARPRFDACREAGKENLKPWMIRCSPKVLNQMLTLSRDKKNVLGGNTIAEYLSDRLKIDDLKMKQLMERHTVVTKIRVTKVKKVLDFLLIEENFHPEEVANNLRVLLNSLETTKKRVKELKDNGCRPSSLVYICYSRKQYQQFLEKWIVKGKKINH